MIIFVVLLINLAVIAVGLIARKELALSISKNTEQIMELNAEKSAKILQDVNKKELYCARDGWGIKPFYYYENNGTFMFGNQLLHCLLFEMKIFHWKIKQPSLKQ